MDTIADMLTKIRNAQMVGHQSVIVSASKIKSAILEILKKEGYIKNFSRSKAEVGEEITINLVYKENLPGIKSIKRVSKSSCRVYVSKDNIPYVLSGKGRSIISTSKGLMSDKAARKAKVGGEVICEVY